MATMIICVKHFVNIPDIFFLIFTLKMIKKIFAIDLKIFHFSQNFWGKYVAMATMICVKHFMNIPDIFFNSCFKNKLRKKKDLFEKFSFFTKI